jgi:hypothetical protein
MYRRKTVEALLRQHQREKEQLLTLIREQTNQLMYMAAKPWLLPPVEDEPEPVTADPDERLDLIEDVAQLADDDHF